MVLAIPGHGCFIHNLPLTRFPFNSTPSSSTKAGSIPGSGKVAYVGIVGVTYGIGESIIPPVSVCHQVSTIGHLPFPTTSLYQCQASSLIGSPTEPNTLSEDRLYLVTKSELLFAKALIAVGAV